MKKMAGFTLAELLIVVAIIAILVAIGIPMFNTAMEKSRETADISNLRAAKAAGAVLHMDGMTVPYTGHDATKIPAEGYVCFYDISQGILLDPDDTRVKDASGTVVLKASGKGTALAGTQPTTEVLMTDGTNEYKPTSNVSNGYIAVLILPSDDESPVQVTFVKSVSDVQQGVSGASAKTASFDNASSENNMLKTYPAGG
ncbi:MAG: prepilin-type N-terminal cleavage/methylation domain-containing protein, partial [Oscillibacter sp.]|nr:prepilin-type N-terminal cleavage/methylation domain-containing protein [Oscillibacter sp.]MBQ9617126.1 prepilin-type N-terminal cleavage/methylation domain-containing protein [Oscillibacter sp.]